MKKHNAFTMLELVFVLIVVGILAAMTIPRLERDYQQEAADNILAAIRYTQHLALNDNKHMFDNPNWQRRFWRIVFGTCDSANKQHFYMIGSDDDMTGGTNGYFSQNEAALDPADGKPMFWTNGTDCSGGGDGTVSEHIFITHKYGITGVTPSGGCTGKYIGFDHMGRPQIGFSNSTKPNQSGYMNSTCTLTFTLSSGNSFQINIEPETGTAYIVGQEDI